MVSLGRLWRRRLAQKISIHDPALPALRLAAEPLDLIHAIRQLARHQDLVLGPDIGAPVDVDPGIADVPERAFPIEHHDDIIDAVGQTLGELAPGGDVHRLSDPVQRDPVSCGQRLHAADAGDHFIRERDDPSGEDLIDDPQRAVVERGVAPDEKGAAFVVAELVTDQSLVYAGSPLVPGLHRRLVCRGASVALGIPGLDGPVRPVLDVAFADVLAQAKEVLLLAPLVHHEEHVDFVERIDRLHGDVVGIAGANADDEDFSHALTILCRSAEGAWSNPAAVIYSHTISEKSPANLQIVSSLAPSAPSPQRLSIHNRAPATRRPFDGVPE